MSQFWLYVYIRYLVVDFIHNNFKEIVDQTGILNFTGKHSIL